MNRKDIEKKIKSLVSLKNQFLNIKNYDKVERIQEQIRILRVKSKEVISPKSNNLDIAKPSRKVRVSVPEIPDDVVINNVDITDMLYRLKNADNSSSAAEIYNSIISMCESRKNYINGVLKKNINSYEFDTELELSSKAKQSLSSLEAYINLDEKDIERKISLLIDSIDSYDLSKSNLRLKSNVKRFIKRIKSRKDLTEEEINNKVSEIMNSINSYIISKKGLRLKPKVKKFIDLLDKRKDSSDEKIDKRVLELVNSIDSYIIDKRCLELKAKSKRLITSLKSRKDLSRLEIEERVEKILNSILSYNISMENLELKSKVKQSITSLKLCKGLSSEEIRAKISKIMDSVDSYNLNKKDLKLKSTLQDELSYINNIISIAFRLLVDIKRKDIKEIKEEVVYTSLTKNQEKILSGIYEENIEECNIDDYYKAFKYFINKEKNIDKAKIEFIISDFFGKFRGIIDKRHIFESFIKDIKRITKNFSNSDKKIINSLMRIQNIDGIEMLENDYRYEILTYFLYQKDKINIKQLISKMPDIANGYYNGKSIVVNIFSEVLDKYNIILCNNKEMQDIIDISEETFLMLYGINNKEKENIEILIKEYIEQLKTIDCSTVSKNIILCRLNKIREKIGMIPKIELPEIDSENYKYLDYYYYEEISNVERRCLDDSVLINNTISYSVVKSGDFVFLKINVVDLTPYFIEGTNLNELAIMDCVDTNKMKKYIKFESGKKSPSITFEFHFYKGILHNSFIYDSIVSPISDNAVNSKYNSILESIGMINLKSDFNELIKVCLKNNEGDIPYIVKYAEEDNKNYKVITDLNHIFSKLDKSCVDIIYQILKTNEQRYGLSRDVVGKRTYDINVLEPSCNFYDILMQKIIKSYYNSSIILDIDTVKQYVNK